MICLAFVLYPIAESFLDKFIESIINQTYPNFDLFILIEPGSEGIKRLRKLDKKIVEINLSKGLTPVENRNKLIENLKRSDYEYIVFADIDDYMSANRIEGCIKELQKGYNVVYNDLVKFSNNKNSGLTPLWGSRLNNLKLPSYSFNVLGLGNTAIKRDVLEGFRRHISSEIFDWSFYLNLNCKTKLEVSLAQGYVFYRVHINSTLNDINSNARLAQLNLEVLNDVEDNPSKQRELISLRNLINKNKLKYMIDGFWFEKE